MCKRFNFDNVISFVGAWFFFITTFGFYYIIWSIFEYKFQKRYSIPKPFLRIFYESLHELKISYWWHC